MNTHRTSPDNEKDTIALKNLCKEAEERLLADERKRDAKLLIKRIQELASQIDHRHNLESLILFVNEDLAEYTRLPFKVKDRIVIDHSFATRDLVRALHQEANYLILVLSQHKVRLIEAFNDKVLKEYSDSFPMENTQFYSTNKAELSNASRQSSLIAEFFNRVDKEVNEVRKTHALPVLICTEQSNYHEYLKVADQKQGLFDMFLNKNRLDEKAQHIVEDAWKILKAHVIERNNAQKQELVKAVSSGKYLSDVNDIYRAILEGRVQTLFIEEGLFQPGLMEDNIIRFVSEKERSKKAVTDDIYDELIEINMNYGGNTVFLPKGELTEFDGFGAITRY
ncbi:hypothetical protein ESY86_00430 [Subsaximicrobium wynnwilliamsii]|uniref:Uncharacterized protein n=1 Tax=Subsaximicrobium wynnwilliamsii TaxID=291179 RepID=A0A5C6ZMN3_9FLAO|nr:hypothetical protein ESY87_01600 [Subsaximicrobium wynnwilliamsii]TXD91326.1 hypothetical protein ESY86_00430 [Subsaximicrobium wynnwilliamsii]TXE04719.1 hypothetical protein ESY88_03080 [Subsaximicrobium wynnwilliamsii]